MTDAPRFLSTAQQVTLIVLRTLIGWHFLYEGYFKLLHPAWSRAGTPLDRFSAAGYLTHVSGPFANLFHALARPTWIPWIDAVVAGALVVAGLCLILGLFTRLGCAIAVGLLSVFYLSAIPLDGLPHLRAEGAYLLVNKNLIEAAAVVLLWAFKTERIAGLDLLVSRGRRQGPRQGIGLNAPA